LVLNGSLRIFIEAIVLKDCDLGMSFSSPVKVPAPLRALADWQIVAAGC